MNSAVFCALRTNIFKYVGKCNLLLKMSFEYDIISYSEKLVYYRGIMKDIIIIGGGIIGCAVARELSRFQVDIKLLERRGDVSQGTTKANSGIVHAGFDAKPNTLKAKFNLLGNATFDELSKQLDFPFKRNGALVLCFDESELGGLKELYDRGIANGVEGLEILDGESARRLEPNISDKVVGALYAKTSGVVSPYEMCIAYAENAAINGCEFIFNKEVSEISKEGEKWRVRTQDGSTYFADFVINWLLLFFGSFSSICFVLIQFILFNIFSLLL